MAEYSTDRDRVGPPRGGRRIGMMKGVKACVASATLLVVVSLPGLAAAQETGEFIPRRQDRPPGPALSPDEAIRRMTVPEGFRVELVASEPDLVNPVAMTFDER